MTTCCLLTVCFVEVPLVFLEKGQTERYGMQGLSCRFSSSWSSYVNSVAADFSPRPVTDSRRLGVVSGSATRWGCVPSTYVVNRVLLSRLLVCRYSLLPSTGRLLFSDARLLLIGRGCGCTYGRVCMFWHCGVPRLAGVVPVAGLSVSWLSFASN